MISRSLPNFNKIAALPELQLSAEWFWGVGGANPIPGGGADLSLLPLAGRGGRAQRAPPHRRPPAREKLVPGPAARLLFEVSPIGGTLAWFRCSGLKVDGFVRESLLFPSVKVLFFIRGNLSAESWTRPCSSPGKTLPRLLTALRSGPTAFWGLAQAQLSHPLSSRHTEWDVPTSIFSREPQACCCFCLEPLPSLLMAH